MVYVSHRPAAFTLIELLIVISILAVLSTFAYDITTRVGTFRQREADRAAALEDAGRALARWREDVAFATSIAVPADGSTMKIERLDENAAPITVVYQKNADGNLIRGLIPAAASNATIQTAQLAASIGDLKFAPNGAGWRMDWNAVARDGIREWRRPMGGFAAPIRPAGVSQP